jgi:NitT/TauT family transport system permease protein
MTATIAATAVERPRRLSARRVLMFPLAFVLVALAWEAYKAVGPEAGGKLFGVRLLPRTGDRAMPHVWEMFRRLGRPEVRGGKESVARVVAEATWYSFRVALLAFVLGTLIGVLLAVAMARFKVVQRALMPYLVISQTIPIIVLAPLILTLMVYAERSLGTKTWIAAVILGVSLAFFPVAVGTLRGLQSAPAASVELMDSMASSWTRTLLKLRFPSAVPYITPSLRLAAASAVVGVVVSEISLGVNSGVGRLILSYGQDASSDPAKLYTAVFGAAVLGLVMALLVLAVDKLLMRQRPQES